MDFDPTSEQGSLEVRMKKSVFSLITMIVLSLSVTSCGTSTKSNTFKAPNGDSTASAKGPIQYQSEWFADRRDR